MKSLLVSVFSTMVDAGLFALCTLFWSGLALVLVRWTCGAIGALTNFILNRSFAFRLPRLRPGFTWVDGGRPRVLRLQLGRYAITALAAITLATSLFLLLHLVTGLDPRVLHLVSLALVWLCFTFPMLRSWVFSHHPR